MGGSGEEHTIRRVEITELVGEATLVVALAEGPDGGGRALILQRAPSGDEQDAALGLDTYCLSDETGASVYGGVLSCILEDDLLILALTPDTADTLALEPLSRFRLRIDTDRLASLRDGLRRIFAEDAGALPTLRL